MEIFVRRHRIILRLTWREKFKMSIINTSNGDGKSELLFNFNFQEMCFCSSIVWSYREVMYTQLHKDVYIERNLHKINITLKWNSPKIKLKIHFNKFDEVLWEISFLRNSFTLTLSIVLIFFNFSLLVKLVGVNTI